MTTAPQGRQGGPSAATVVLGLALGLAIGLALGLPVGMPGPGMAVGALAFSIAVAANNGNPPSVAPWMVLGVGVGFLLLGLSLVMVFAA